MIQDPGQPHGSGPAWSGRTAGLTVILLLLSARRADAYIDPGSGALLWQMAAAAAFGALFYVRRVVNWVKARFGRRRADGPNA